jgi:transcriptional regulator with XRE-family HTH domain
LELHWLQTDVAAKIGISSTSVSNWERGITSPSRRMTKRIREFLDYASYPLSKVQRRNFHCQTCGIPDWRGLIRADHRVWRGRPSIREATHSPGQIFASIN